MMVDDVITDGKWLRIGSSWAEPFGCDGAGGSDSRRREGLTCTGTRGLLLFCASILKKKEKEEGKKKEEKKRTGARRDEKEKK